MRVKGKYFVMQLLLPLMVIFQFGQANFFHFHVSNRGELIAHSHPYQIKNTNDKDEPSPGHNHSNAELLCLQFFDGHFVNDVEFQSLCVLQNERFFEYGVFNKTTFSTTFYGYQFAQRGPPRVSMV